MDDRETNLIISKAIDEATSVIRDHRIRYTSFYNPFIIKTLEGILKKYPEIDYARYGGYPEAERASLIMYPSYMDKPSEDSFFQALKISWNSQYYTVDHRDILGSFIGFGISRERIGDILVDDDTAYVFTFLELADFIAGSLIRVGSVPVNVTALPCNQILVPQPKIKSISTTVASPRLDSIISACFGLSRTKTLPYILNSSVSVNWELIQKPDFILSPGDIISVRGLGRGRVKELGKITRKNRLFVVLEKYL